MSAESTGLVRPRLQVLAAAVLFSTGGAAVKATTLSGIQVASFRSGVAALAILAALAFLPIDRPRLSPGTWLVGGAYAATLTLFVVASKLTTAANAVFLQSTAPLYILLLGPWLLGERLRRRDLGYLVAMAVGLCVFFLGREAATASAPEPLLGNVLAATAGLTYALTVVGLRWLGRDHARRGSADLGAVLCGNLLACLVVLPFALPVSQEAASFELRDLIAIVYLGVVQIGLAYFLLNAGIRRLGALEVSLLVLLEPVLNPLWTWLLIGEVPNHWTFVGGGVILGATLIHTIGVAARMPRGSRASSSQGPSRTGQRSGR